MEQSVIKRWDVIVEIDEWGHPCIEVPDEVIEILGLSVGDPIEWIANDNGSYTLKKKEEKNDNL